MKINGSIFLMSAMILLPGLLTAEVSRSETDFGYVNKFTVDEVDYQANVYTRTGTAWSLSIPNGVEEVEYLIVAGGGSGGGGASMSDGTKGGRGGCGVVVLRYQTYSGLVIMIQ